MTRDIAEAISDLRYRERFHLSYDEFMNEPAEVVRRNKLIWSLEADRDNLEDERSKTQ